MIAVAIITSLNGTVMWRHDGKFLWLCVGIIPATVIPIFFLEPVLRAGVANYYGLSETNAEMITSLLVAILFCGISICVSFLTNLALNSMGWSDPSQKK